MGWYQRRVHGDSHSGRCRFNMIKTVLLTCFVAAIKADADAFYGYPYVYGAYPYAAAVPYGSSTGLDPITQGHVIGKRSADADAYYGHAYGAYPYAYGAYAAAVPFGSSTGLDPITQGLDLVTQGVAVPAYGHYIGKRSADADAYYGYTYGAYPYAYGAYPYAAAVPFGSSTGLDPITQGLDPVTQGVAVPAYGYAGYAYGK